MAFPPFRGGRMPFFPPQTSSIPNVPLNNGNQKFGFFTQTPILSSFKTDAPIPSSNIPIPVSTVPVMNTKYPITTVFVGNITELCSNDLVQKILKLCGAINNWKRLQDTNSKYKAFGFCEFIHPEGTLRALRILNKYQLADKKLTVKTDDATSKMLQEFTEKKKASGITGSKNEETDEQIIEKIVATIKEEKEELIEIAEKAAKESIDEGRIQSRSANLSASPADRLSNSLKESSSKKHRKRLYSPSSKRRSRSNSRRADVSKSSRTSRSPLNSKSQRKKKSHKNSSSESSSWSSSSSSDESSSSVKKKRHRKFSPKHYRHRSRTHSSDEDSDEILERKRLRQEIKRKEQSYLKRLEKWEERERRMAKQYEKDEQDEVQRKKMLQREAKKLRQFLEDYEDERDDVKYYKSSSLFQRRKNYEREREEDAKDRQEELHEIEELKKQILAENKNVEDADAEARKLHEAKGKEKLKSVRSHSGSPTPHRPLGHPQNGVDPEKDELTSNGNESSQNESLDEKDQQFDIKQVICNENINHSWANEENAKMLSPPINEGAIASSSSTSLTLKKGKSAPKLIATLQKPSIARVNGVFEEDDEEEVQLIKKKIKPFEITREDRIQSMTPEERKKLIKDLIERIPTAKDELFSFNLSWEYVNDALIEKRLKPWINRKISDYIGDEEPSLVSFICEKIASRTEPKKILGDLAMVLDDEAEVFMIKLWRLIIYESEAKKLGLSVLPQTGINNEQNLK